MSRDFWVTLGIGLLTVFALWVVWPQKPSNYFPLPLPERGWLDIKIGDFNFVRKGMTLGLDLQGGTDLVLQADLSQQPVGTGDEAMKGVRAILEQRVNAFGVAEPIISLVGSDRISVQLPGVKDIEEAKNLVGKTAQLDFREMELDPSGVPLRDDRGQPLWKKATGKLEDGSEVNLTGKYFERKTAVIFNQQKNTPEVSFQLRSDGAKLFEQITTRLVQKPLGIFLDDELISAPTVQAVLRDGGVITGLTLVEAQRLTIQLNAGALPVPISIIKERDVDATLGEDSVRKSIVAGEVGFLAVLLFMLFTYRLPGLLAGIALVNYTVYVLAIFKLVPVTLTLAGIAAFILSIGMAVDANILIFERTKEELRMGRTIASAIEAGFERAWPSIRDSNVASFISAGILYWFGSSFGASLIMGFALTLAIGVAVSMFSAIMVTRLLLRFFIGSSVLQNSKLLGMR